MLNKNHILDERYKIIKILGKGGMSTVYLCENIRMNIFYAVKEIKKQLPPDYEYKCEVNILKDLNHFGIPKVLDYFEESGNFYIVEEYFHGETLIDYISSKNNVKIETLYKVINDICDILIYLHSFEQPIIYRDLKPSNIMIDSKGNVKLIDFGIARVYKPSANKDTVFLGSSGFIAPELFNGNQSNILTDIYSFGATINYICDKTGCQDENLKEIAKKAMSTESNKRFKSMKDIKKLLFINKGFKAKLNRKTALVGFTTVVCMLCIITAFLLIKGNTEKKQVKLPPKQEQVKTDTPVVVPVKSDYFIDGTVVKSKTVSSAEFTSLKGKKKLFDLFDNIYKIEPKAEAVLFDEKVTFQVDYIEYKINEELIYCTLINDSESNVVIGSKDTATLYDTKGKGIEGKFVNEGNAKVSPASTNSKIIISFSGLDSKDEQLQLKTDITDVDKDDTHGVRINLKIKN